MRRFLFSLLILLTALRGGIGDAMAYRMTQGMMSQMSTTSLIASSANSMPATEHFEHQKAIAMPCHEVSQDDPGAQGASPACTTCQVCHLSVSLPWAVATAVQALPQAAQPSQPVAVWASADLALFSKPPIV